MTKALIAALGLVLIVAACSHGLAQPEAELRDGDIIFQTSRSPQSLAIQRGTRSPYSHMGLVLHRGGEPFVLEAAATVRYTPLAKWIARGEDGRYVAKRLGGGPFSSLALRKLRAEAEKLEGKRYDLAFEWSDERMYCSELVWKIYERALGVRLGSLARFDSFDYQDPVVQKKITERYGENPPLDEPVISPAAIFASPALQLVEI